MIFQISGQVRPAQQRAGGFIDGLDKLMMRKDMLVLKRETLFLDDWKAGKISPNNKEIILHIRAIDKSPLAASQKSNLLEGIFEKIIASGEGLDQAAKRATYSAFLQKLYLHKHTNAQESELSNWVNHITNKLENSSCMSASSKIVLFGDMASKLINLDAGSGEGAANKGMPDEFTIYETEETWEPSVEGTIDKLVSAIYWQMSYISWGMGEKYQKGGLKDGNLWGWRDFWAHDQLPLSVSSRVDKLSVRHSENSREYCDYVLSSLFEDNIYDAVSRKYPLPTENNPNYSQERSSSITLQYSEFVKKAAKYLMDAEKDLSGKYGLPNNLTKAFMAHLIVGFNFSYLRTDKISQGWPNRTLDCDTSAILVGDILLASGVPRNMIGITIVHTRDNPMYSKYNFPAGTPHAVLRVGDLYLETATLLVNQDKTDFLIETLDKSELKWRYDDPITDMTFEEHAAFYR